jgi:hypothetical protein
MGRVEEGRVQVAHPPDSHPDTLYPLRPPV